MKYYAVKKGLKPGIYTSWDDCKKQVYNFSGAVYKSFGTREAAMDFMEQKPPRVIKADVICYVDGSFNLATRTYGYGGVLIKDDQVIKKFKGRGTNSEYASMRNVAGEILGSLKAIDHAIKLGYKSIVVYYDYEGIEKWADKLWQARKPGTIEYVEKIDKYRKQINITFVKVAAHSGDYYNDMVDKLAKEAVGISE